MLCHGGKPARKQNAFCPKCGKLGIRVSLEPVKFLVEEASRVRGDVYFLCETRGCDTVYFDEKGDRILRSELRVRIGAKETQTPHLVCYCFFHTEEAVEAEIRIHGKTTIPDRIRAEIDAGTCECKVRNPRGKCCLGEVMRVVKKYEAANA